MTFKYAERVQSSSTSTGTGDLVLAGATDTTYQAFSAVFSNGDTTDVAIFGAGDFEACRATYNTGANSITRGARYASSNGGAAVNFGAGTKTIIVSAPGALLSWLGNGAADTTKFLNGNLAFSTPPAGMSAEERQNFSLNLIYDAKAFGGYRRMVDVFADGFKASDGVASITGGAVDTTNGRVSPTVTTATTGTFGQANVGVGRSLAAGAGIQLGFKFTAPVTATVTSVKINIISQSSASTSVARLYTDTGTSPGTLIGSESASQDTGSTGDKTFTFSSPPSMTSGTAYWIVITPVTGTINCSPSVCSNQAGYGSGRNNTITSLVDDNIGGNGEDWRVDITYTSTGANNMTLVSTAQTSDAARTKARALIEYNPIDAITLNTDMTIDLTCNGGTNWTAATLTAVGTGQAGRLVAETAEVTCTSGTSFQYRWKTLTNKAFQGYGITLKVAP